LLYKTAYDLQRLGVASLAILLLRIVEEHRVLIYINIFIYIPICYIYVSFSVRRAFIYIIYIIYVYTHKHCLCTECVRRLDNICERVWETAASRHPQRVPHIYIYIYTILYCADFFLRRSNCWINIIITFWVCYSRHTS